MDKYMRFIGLMLKTSENVISHIFYRQKFYIHPNFCYLKLLVYFSEYFVCSTRSDS